MDVAISTALITGLLTLSGTLITVWGSQKKLRDDITAQLSKHNAVQDERIKTLTEKVEKHNNVVERTFALEGRVDCLSKRVTDLSVRTGGSGEDC